ncbi:Rv3654c family TadE-like protein [Streptomyces sp. NPDC090119]|uniref:Rv3654c family TadE-like protein n=1 Tax=Streptomyces sp. NPDC090119 TaxID=3365951 RepID=UPI00380D500B
MRCRKSDRGSATVWSLGVIALLCLVFGAVLGMGHAVVVRHRAAGAADLAALAAADHWAEGVAAACAAGRRVASAQGARLVRCALVGEISDVSAGSGGGPFGAEVRARAGPPDPSGTEAWAPASQAPAPSSPRPLQQPPPRPPPPPPAPPATAS